MLDISEAEGRYRFARNLLGGQVLENYLSGWLITKLIFMLEKYDSLI
jgi:hypothetical protein